MERIAFREFCVKGGTVDFEARAAPNLVHSPLLRLSDAKLRGGGTPPLDSQPDGCG